MNNIKKKEIKNDIVFTPQKIVDIMIDDIDINMSILDPCSGNDIFFNSFKNINKQKCENLKSFILVIYRNVRKMAMQIYY
jgi:type I restriction-modification system DNA methylase subunit